MKKFYMTIVAMLCGVAAMAQTELYAENVKIEKGTEEFEFEISLKNDVDVTALSFRLALPQGVAMPLDEEGDYEEGVEISSRAKKHQAILQKAADGADMISIYNEKKRAIDGNDGVIVTIPLAVDPDFAAQDGEYVIKVYEISIADPAGTSLDCPKEFTVTLTVGEGTGINSINAADSKAPVYNVAGQRVNKAQKGVYIQNGKKIAVK
jgi:hypothetical protein